MAIETTPLGFQKPDGNEDVRNGDNVITANAAKDEELHQDSRGRLSLIEARNAAQDGRLDEVVSKNTAQDGRLTSIEAKDAAQDGRLNTLEATNVGQNDVLTSHGTRLGQIESKNGDQDGRLGALEDTVAYSADPGMPVVGDANPTYAEVTIDRAGRIADATLPDGTRHIPSMKADVAVLAGIKSAANDDPTYAELTVDQSARITDAILPDGTRYLPSMKSDTAQIAGVKVSVNDGLTYAEATVDQSGRISDATLPDGTRYFPRLSVDALTVGGTSATDTAPIDVLIIAGQSNSQYAWYSATAPVLRPSDPRLLVWGDIDQNIVPVQVGQPDDVPKGIARAMRRTFPERAVLIVPMGVGGTGFSGTSLADPPAGYHTNTNGAGSWDRFLTADPKNLAAAMIANAKAAIAATGTRLGNVTFAWIQGESDAAYMTQAQYQTALDDLFTWTRAQLNLPNLPIVVGGLVPERIDAYSDAEKGVVRAHIDTPRRLLNTAYQPGPRDYTEYLELVHYSKPGRTIHGTAMYTAFERAKLNVVTSNPITPHNLAIVRLADAVKITWDAPPCRATSYNLETSTDGDAWTACPLPDGPLGLSYTMTTAAAARISARISTTNEVGKSITTKVDA